MNTMLSKSTALVLFFSSFCLPLPGHAHTLNIHCPSNLADFTFANYHPPTEHFCDQAAGYQQALPNSTILLWQGKFFVFAPVGQRAQCISKIANQVQLTTSEILPIQGGWQVQCTYSETPKNSYVYGNLPYATCYQQGENHFKCKY